MEYPKLRELKTSRDMSSTFRGYNHNLRIADGEFYDMVNLSSDNWPVMTVRRRRGVYARPENTQGLIGKNGLCYVDGENFVVNGTVVQMGLSSKQEDCPKQLVSMGAYVIILPDKMWINTMDLSQFGKIEAHYASADQVQFSLCRADGSVYTKISETKPEITEDMESGKEEVPVWLDTSTEPHSLKQYSLATGIWTTVASTYIKIAAEGIGKEFAVYDAVKISGVQDEALQDLNATMTIWSKDDDYIVVTGIIDKVTTQAEAISVSRAMPEMDFVIESENRLWGCRYGTAANGETVNEIYASKLGDFKNWNSFMGLSTDSYAVSLGTDGPFTGAITYLGYPTFFKENAIHSIYGSSPSKYQMQSVICPGVQKGSHRSLAIVNEVLLYKGTQGVFAYNGAMPSLISGQFGSEIYTDAVAGGHRGKYYISMLGSNGEAALFAYDTEKTMWHKEDDLRVSAFCSSGDELYFIDERDGVIGTVYGSGTEDSRAVKWMAQTGVLGADLPDSKYLSKIAVRMMIPTGARAKISVEYDSGGYWEHLCTLTGRNLRSFTIPVRLRRCDHLRLKLEGEGDVRVYSITKTIYEGSDVV